MNKKTTGEQVAADAVVVSGTTVRIGGGPEVTCPTPASAEQHAAAQRREISGLIDQGRQHERASCVQQIRADAVRARRFWFVGTELHAMADKVAKG